MTLLIVNSSLKKLKKKKKIRNKKSNERSQQEIKQGIYFKRYEEVLLYTSNRVVNDCSKVNNETEKADSILKYRQLYNNKA